MVKKRKEPLDLGLIFKRGYDDAERALLEIQGKIAETINRIAEVDQWAAEVNAAAKGGRKEVIPMRAYERKYEGDKIWWYKLVNDGVVYKASTGVRDSIHQEFKC
ncbi:MAG: hypothetical protein J2P21_10810 [Chloracidobacterium sp.]|nr:hypothetical protein [Chloracidobacterium sp.]